MRLQICDQEIRHPTKQDYCMHTHACKHPPACALVGRHTAGRAVPARNLPRTALHLQPILPVPHRFRHALTHTFRMRDHRETNPLTSPRTAACLATKLSCYLPELHPVHQAVFWDMVSELPSPSYMRRSEYRSAVASASQLEQHTTLARTLYQYLKAFFCFPESPLQPEF